MQADLQSSPNKAPEMRARVSWPGIEIEAAIPCRFHGIEPDPGRVPQKSAFHRNDFGARLRSVAVLGVSLLI